jgi:pimeloyl-ACP methyl ester carboxylesterase
MANPSPVHKARIETYRSEIDGEERPYAVCSNASPSDPAPLMVEVSPGGTNLEKSIGLVEKIVEFASLAGKKCVAIRPTGRGPGSVYQNYGEVDTFEAISDAMDKFRIDRERISVTGASMGGAATWYLVSHHPDFFSAGAPFCGYCDYRLWEKPGGLTFHMLDWEEPSWMARSAALLPENFAHTPMWIVHGEWDRSVGGGVPVEHSRRMFELLTEYGCDVRYTESPGTGHGCRTDEIFQKVVPWLLEQKRTEAVDDLTFATFELRHNRSHWAVINQLKEYGGKRASLSILRARPGEISITTENVRTFVLERAEDDSSKVVRIDGQPLDAIGPVLPGAFRRDAKGDWSVIEEKMISLEKRRGCSGPISDLFHANTLLVAGTSGSEEESHFHSLVARKAASSYASFNGGVHRGGILGENNVDLKVVTDTELSETDRRANNLLLYGTQATNSILAHFGERLSLEFQKASLTVNGRVYEGDKVALMALFPHPENPDRYVAVHGGVTPDAITWGSHLNLNLLPDFIVYNGGDLLDWGFWNNEWK